ncbi:MAG: hypothetical protein NXI22_13130 [bacterium]|nr:hypothetical protein [bacterium]
MKFNELLILLPCHSLEDFPLHHEGEEAQGLLANWTALWHPTLIAEVDAMPKWGRVDDPPEELAGKLMLVPDVSAGELPTGFAQRAKGDGALLIRRKTVRAEIIKEILDSLDSDAVVPSDDLVADFLALGYCYLQVELLTRQMRYSSNLDEVYFEQQVVAAARAAKENDEPLAREKLAACFDVLAEERNHYYPVDAFLIDITLVASTTIGEKLRNEMQCDVAKNLLISGDVITEMSQQEPETLAAVKEAVEAKRVSLIGGDSNEPRLPLLSCESILAELQTGASQYQSAIDTRPTVYGRRRFGLTPFLPQVLDRLGFQGALHATLDDGRFPEGVQIKTRWEAEGGASINALARAPLDANKPGNWLGLAMKIGESMDMDHVATICFVHWPGQNSTWLEDLRRISKYCPALGKFVTVDEYFAETDHATQVDRFKAGQYQSPYLKQAVIRRHENPISCLMNYWRRHHRLEAAQSLHTLASLVTGDIAGNAAEEIRGLFQSVTALAESRPAADTDSDDTESANASNANSEIDAQIETAVTAAGQRLAAALPRQESAATDGRLILNSLNTVRRVGIETVPLSSLPKIEKPIFAASQRGGDATDLVIDTPPMGFVWVHGQNGSEKPAVAAMAEDNLLRNEFFEAVINPETGSLQAIHEYKTRGNRISQQLAFRLPQQSQGAGGHYVDPDTEAAYSMMEADEVAVSNVSAAMGEITCKGRLLDPNGKELAKYTQRYRVLRGSRILRLKIDLEPLVQPKADAWRSYFAARFAWKSEATDLFTTLQQTRQAVSGKRLEAPHYIELVQPKQRTAILTGGLPFHRRIGLRNLDTLLVVRNESARSFELGIGVDLTHPYNEAVSMLSPPVVVTENAAPPKPADSSWLFHIDSRNISATSWEPLEEAGAVVGFRVRLLETAGRATTAHLQSFRPVGAASLLDFNGESITKLSSDDKGLEIQFAPRQWQFVEARWK